MRTELARRVYWNASLVTLVIMHAGAYLKHQSHNEHGASCACLPSNCLACATDGIREAMKGRD